MELHFLLGSATSELNGMYLVSSFWLESCRASEHGLTTQIKTVRFLITVKPVLNGPHSNWKQASIGFDFFLLILSEYEPVSGVKVM